MQRTTAQQEQEQEQEQEREQEYATMAEVLPIGIEEEFQTVNAATLALATHGYAVLMRRATPQIRQRMQPEFLQCVVECVTDPCQTVAEAHAQTMQLHATVMRLAKKGRMAVISAGTHPFSRWDEQVMWEGKRYQFLQDALQDVARSILIYGLHVHVQITDDARRIAALNLARTYLPYILALSVNSPFWQARLTGYQSFRTIVWAPFPFSGIPDPFPSADSYHDFMRLMERVGAVGKIQLPDGAVIDGRRVWWDLRAHQVHPTLEFRIADMPATHADTMAIVAFIQALVKTLLDRLDQNQPLPVVPTPILNENRWRAARWGLRGRLIDFARGQDVPTVELLAETLDLIAPAAEALGTGTYMAYLRAMLEPGYKTGAERQLDAYAARGSLKDVARLLVAETRRGIAMDTALKLGRRGLFRRRRGGAALAMP
jgi:carboxylate-amine ligase